MSVQQTRRDEVDTEIEVVVPRYSDVAEIVDEEGYKRALEELERMGEGELRALAVKTVVSYLHSSGYLAKIMGNPALVYVYEDPDVVKKFIEGYRKYYPILPDVIEVKGYIRVEMKNRQ